MGVKALTPAPPDDGLTHEGRVNSIGEWPSHTIVPNILAVACFIAGSFLLFTGALPVPDVRMNWLRTLLSLPVVEVSHFIGSVSGAALLILAHALQRRLDAAWLLVVILLGTGIISSLFKGVYYEQAALLVVLLGVLIHWRRIFYRKASLFKQRLSPPWAMAMLLVMIGSFSLLLFAHQHTDYSQSLWWQFTLIGDASRSLRAIVGSTMVLVLFAASYLMRLSPPTAPPLDPIRREKVKSIVDSSPRASANLAFLDDKRFLFAQEDDAFIMYGCSGRSWIGLGEPIGPSERSDELLWDFRDMCEYYGGWPVFLEVPFQPTYLEMGLTLRKIGEEARVPLESFSLAQAKHSGLRRPYRHARREGLSFEILPANAISAVLPVLNEISDEWLATKHVGEKCFSLGRFDPEYLQRFPLAIVKRKDQVLAFSNLWLASKGEEFSADLVRHRADVPNGVMDYLLIELMIWGHATGYRWFNLGLAPLSGMDDHSESSPWCRISTFLYRHGEHFYNFRGLRYYKEKFSPLWQPRYLAAPGGLALPKILTDVATLVSGSLKGIVSK